jgi:iron complex transport system ATP-binding protein
MSAAGAAGVALATRGLGVRLGGRWVVDDVSLEIAPGQWLALVGPNGAGKSSLLALMAGVLAPGRGEVECGGRALAQWPARERARRLAWLAQAGESDGEIAVREVALLGRLPHHGLFGAPTPHDVAVAAAAMRDAEVEHLGECRLSALSGGERQRALIARALAVEAPLLLLDEPTAHLDAPHQRTLVRTLRRRVAAGAAAVTVLHDLTLALQADRVAVMVAGRLAMLGAPDDPALRAALEAAFDHSFAIRELAPAVPGAPRWIAVPLC